jgi:hypothetical protein
MNEEKARGLIEDEGFTVLSFIEEEDGVFIFSCKGTDDSEIEVCVMDGQVIVSPT